jgi:hypothetical protein
MPITRPSTACALLLVLVASCPEPYNGPITPIPTTEAPDARKDDRDAAAGAGAVDGPTAPDGAQTDAEPEVAACPAGFHRCGDRCTSDLDPDSCGRSCEACPSIRGGTRTCDGRTCGISCPTGTKPCVDSCVPENAPCDDKCLPGQNLCGGLCVDGNSLSACGPACSPCPSSPNGTTTCDGTRCELICKAGFHRCDDRCESNTSTASCGDSCSPCPVPAGGRASCDGEKCGFDCPGGRKCGNICIDNDEPCNGACPSGLRLCNERCVPNDPGPCCVPGSKRCNPNGRAVQTCTASAAFADSMSCSLGCDPAGPACRTCQPQPEVCNRLDDDCDGQVDEVAKPETCNGLDDDCDGQVDDNVPPVPCNPACAGNRVCRPGAGLDPSACAPTNTVERCGSSCTRCPAPPAGGTMACEGGRCVASCPGGTLCDGRCLPPDRVCDGRCDQIRCRSACVPASTGCPPTRPLRLFFSGARLDNYTAASDGGVANAVNSGYGDAGTMGHIESQQLPGTKPLFCYFNPTTGDNLVTDASSAPSGFGACNLGGTGNVEGFVYSSARSGTVPIILWLNDSDRRDHHLITDGFQNDADLIGQNYRKLRTVGHALRQPN